MKIRLMTGALSVVACTFLLAGSAMGQGGDLMRAEWGVPGRSVDVTSRVRTFIHNGALQFEVTRFELGVDPAPHQNKTLLLRIRHWDGDVKEYSYPERSTVRLELDPEGGYERHDERADRREDREEHHEQTYERREPGLHILRAYYGAEGQFMNVTDVLRRRIDDGRLYVRVDNDDMGGDPLPGVHKWLRILYVYDGERRNIVVDEKTDLRLP